MASSGENGLNEVNSRTELKVNALWKDCSRNNKRVNRRLPRQISLKTLPTFSKGKTRKLPPPALSKTIAMNFGLTAQYGASHEFLLTFMPSYECSRFEPVPKTCRNFEERTKLGILSSLHEFFSLKTAARLCFWTLLDAF